MEFTGPDPVSSILDVMMSALRTALGATQAGVPGRMEIAHGASRPTVDSVGMGWVRVAQQFVSMDQFGQPDNLRSRRITPFRWAVEVELGVMRCVPTIETAANRAALPSADAITTSTAGLADDARALRIAAVYLHPYRQEALWKPMQPISPAGGSAGWTISVTLPFDDCKPTGLA